ncbi:MAG: uroporphyrinogen decarboxylase family protein [Capsulimonadaceae bacterium]|nr:uroporphyrinogen decarboxylase family protein [Capsulimonadaceae bacterium]
MLTNFDYAAHNAEVKEVWAAYRAGKPIRTPVIWGINTRYTMFNDAANPRRITFEQYFNDPSVMLERQLEHQEYIRLNIPQDAEMGLPAEGWNIGVDFQNTYEAAWFGCEIDYSAEQVPDTRPMLGDDNKRLLFDRGIPDPFEGGLMRRNWSFREHILKAREDGFTWRGKPLLSVSPSAMGTDGPLTVACNLRGASAFLTDMIEDPDYARELLDYITEATIVRIQAYRKVLGMPDKTQSWGFADDSIQLISCAMYEDMVFPYHKRLVDAFSTGGPNGVHLCGNSSRHFAFMKQNLAIHSFDTGFPIDFTAVRESVGPDVEILGGPSVPFLQRAAPDQVRAEVRRILDSGVRTGGKFVLREGNNLAPDIPFDNLVAMYDEGKAYGRYQ